VTVAVALPPVAVAPAGAALVQVSLTQAMDAAGKISCEAVPLSVELPSLDPALERMEQAWRLPPTVLARARAAGSRGSAERDPSAAVHGGGMAGSYAVGPQLLLLSHCLWLAQQQCKGARLQALVYEVGCSAGGWISIAKAATEHIFGKPSAFVAYDAVPGCALATLSALASVPSCADPPAAWSPERACIFDGVGSSAFSHVPPGRLDAPDTVPVMGCLTHSFNPLDELLAVDHCVRTLRCWVGAGHCPAGVLVLSSSARDAGSKRWETLVQHALNVLSFECSLDAVLLRGPVTATMRGGGDSARFSAIVVRPSGGDGPALDIDPWAVDESMRASLFHSCPDESGGIAALVADNWISPPSGSPRLDAFCADLGIPAVEEGTLLPREVGRSRTGRSVDRVEELRGELRQGVGLRFRPHTLWMAGGKLAVCKAQSLRGGTPVSLASVASLALRGAAPRTEHVPPTLPKHLGPMQASVAQEVGGCVSVLARVLASE
jgi:hypothetical protein